MLKRKLPKVNETLDALPVIIVCPSQTPEEIGDASFDNLVDVFYNVDIVFVAANNQDQSTNLDEWLEWRQQIRRAFGQPDSITSTVASIWDIEIRPMAPLDRTQINNNYDYSGLTIRFKSQEVRS